jgi:ketosteroid isomerase-like protein
MLTDPERAELTQVIVDRMNAYRLAIQSLDPTNVAEIYSESPDFRVYSDGQAFDRDGLLEAVGAMGESLDRAEAEWGEIEVTPLGRTAALAAAPFTRSLTDTDGNTVTDWGTVTWVWTLEGDTWRLIHGQAVHYPDEDSGESL